MSRKIIDNLLVFSFELININWLRLFNWGCWWRWKFIQTCWRISWNII